MPNKNEAIYSCGCVAVSKTTAVLCQYLSHVLDSTHRCGSNVFFDKLEFKKSNTGKNNTMLSD
jgi:hypothetical protein